MTISAAITTTRRALAAATRSFNSSATYLRSPRLPPNQKDLFTVSPFARSDTLPVNNDYVIHRELKEGDNAYGIRRYLLLPRNVDDDYSKVEFKDVIASLNANQNVMFGARVHGESNLSEYLNSCGPLLDVAKEDASINGQQPQALCTLNGLCDWVKECLDNSGAGSDVLSVLMHEKPAIQQPITDDEEISSQYTNQQNQKEKPEYAQKIPDRTAKYTVLDNEVKIRQLQAITAIATGIPRPGHSVVGMGTYRDGEDAWIALAWEYSRLASAWDEKCRKGLEEMVLYKGRDGEVSSMEHLGHTEEGYLRSAGGTMARLFFV